MRDQYLTHLRTCRQVKPGTAWNALHLGSRSGLSVRDGSSNQSVKRIPDISRTAIHGPEKPNPPAKSAALKKAPTSHQGVGRDAAKKNLKQCPLCQANLREDRYGKHMSRVHPQKPAFPESAEPLSLKGSVRHTSGEKSPETAKPDAKPNATIHDDAGGIVCSALGSELKQCPYCPSKVREDRYSRHIARVHESETALPIPQPVTTEDHLLDDVENSAKSDFRSEEDRRIECDCGGQDTCVMCGGSGWFIEHYDGDFTPGSVMAIHKDVAQLSIEAINEYLLGADLCLKYRKSDGGRLEYPATLLLFCVIDALGGYVSHDESSGIPTSEPFHVLRHSCFGHSNLTIPQIKKLEWWYRNGLAHNGALPAGTCLSAEEGEPFEFATNGDPMKIRSVPLYRLVEAAWKQFDKSRIQPMRKFDTRKMPIVGFGFSGSLEAPIASSGALIEPNVTKL